MGVYGEMLLAFPEQIRSFLLFDAEAGLNDGYGPRQNIVKANGVIQTSTSTVKDENGNLVRSVHYRLWTKTKFPDAIGSMGRFVDFGGIVYRVMSESDWPTEGGFYFHDLEKVIGTAPGKASVPADAWETGEGNFG
jgi:hypothetical protein